MRQLTEQIYSEGNINKGDSIFLEQLSNSSHFLKCADSSLEFCLSHSSDTLTTCQEAVTCILLRSSV